MARYYKYPPERLAEVAAQAASMNDVLTRLGLPQLGGYHTHISRQIRQFGIDISHFGTNGRTGVPYSGDPEALARAVAASRSAAETTRALGLANHRSAHRLVRRWIAETGLDTSHFTSRAANKGRRSPKRFPPDQVLRLEAERTRRIKPRRLKNALEELGRAYQCALCGVGDMWHGKQLTLEVDHINGDWRDNRAENLRYLCPNCHTQTDTYRGRRRGDRVVAQRTPTPAD